jgi:hypothetical protein
VLFIKCALSKVQVYLIKNMAGGTNPTVQYKQARTSLFISHAAEDKDFALWLGSRLSAAGYDVWADVLRLKGGDDWARVLEDALRNKALKMLLVATKDGIEKQGVRNEIAMAVEVAKATSDSAFTIPLRLENYTPPFLAVQHQWIDFKNGWGSGLQELLETLQEIDGLSRTLGLNEEGMAKWLKAQQSKSAFLENTPEVLISNWLHILQLPSVIRYFSFSEVQSRQYIETSIENYDTPIYEHGEGFFGFGNSEDYALSAGGENPELVQEIPTKDFLQNGYASIKIQPREAKNILIVLIRESVEKFFIQRGLSKYEYSNRANGFWAPLSLIPSKTRISFNWRNEWKGSRNLTGEITKSRKKINWHYGITVNIRLNTDEPYVLLTPRLVFSENGNDLIQSTRKMHALRRSVPRSWRNDRLRDLLLAFLFWLTDGKEELNIKLGSDQTLRISPIPITMLSPVSINSLNEETSNLETDDPVFATEEVEDEASEAE